MYVVIIQEDSLACNLPILDKIKPRLYHKDTPILHPISFCFLTLRTEPCVKKYKTTFILKKSSFCYLGIRRVWYFMT